METLTPLKAAIARQWHLHGRETPIDGLNLTLAPGPFGPIHAVYRPSLCVVAQGAKVSMLGDKAFRYGAAKCLIASLEVPISAETAR